MVTLVRAPNPSPLTLTGTNSYLIDCGNGQAICIDPGPPIEKHVAALQRRAQELGCTITAICLTHSHPDHAPAAPSLASRSGAPVYAHAAAAAPHDCVLRDGDRVRIGEVELLSIATPGHTADHLAFYEPREGALFTGDTVVGEGYALIAPPEGEMRAYQRTLKRLLNDFFLARTIYGGHGEPVNDPAAKLRDYIAHREQRECELLRALSDGPQTVEQLVARIYAATDRAFWPAAGQQLLAYLIALQDETRVRFDGQKHTYALCPPSTALRQAQDSGSPG